MIMDEAWPVRVIPHLHRISLRNLTLHSRQLVLPPGVVVDAADTLCAAVPQPPPSRGRALSDPGMEDLLYEAESVRRFVGLRLSGPLPDETTILNFRHLLEERRLGQGLMEEINRHLASQGLRLREGTIMEGEHHRGAVVDEEWRWRARPTDASDKEGERVAFWYESAHRGGLRDGSGA